MQSVAIEQMLDRLVETKYADVTVYLVIKAEFSKSGIVKTWWGERSSKAGDHTKVLKKIYTLKKGCEITLLVLGNTTKYIGSGEKIELLSTELEARNTMFFIVNPKLSDSHPNHRIAMTFRKVSEAFTRRF